MDKFTHIVSNGKNILKNFTLTTPVAIIIGSIIISAGIVEYGLIVRGGASSGTTATNPLPKILKTVGVNKNDFAECVNSGELAKSVSDSTQDGVQAGVTGTPSTFVLREEGGNFYVVANISGAQDKELFKQAIEQALSLKGAAKLAKFEGRPVGADEFQEVTNPTKVYVVEYSDAECPFCMRVHPTLKDLRTEYAGKISFVYRHFPLTSIHQHAQKEAEMISCVGKLEGAEALYKFIDLSFDYKLKNGVGYLPWETSGN